MILSVPELEIKNKIQISYIHIINSHEIETQTKTYYITDRTNNKKMGCVSGKAHISIQSGSRVADRPRTPNTIAFVLSKADKAFIRETWQVLKLHVVNVGVIMLTR